MTYFPTSLSLQNFPTSSQQMLDKLGGTLQNFTVGVFYPTSGVSQNYTAIMYSYDGIYWNYSSLSNISNSPCVVGSNGNAWVLAHGNSGYVYASLDGVNWSQVYSCGYQYTPYYVCWSGSTWYVGTGNTTFQCGNITAGYGTTNQWGTFTPPAPGNSNTIAGASNGTYALLAANNVYLYNTITGTCTTSAVPYNYNGSNGSIVFTALASNGNLWLAGGSFNGYPA